MALSFLINFTFSRGLVWLGFLTTVFTREGLRIASNLSTPWYVSRVFVVLGRVNLSGGGKAEHEHVG